MALGHEVELLPAQHVKAFVRGNKNDLVKDFSTNQLSGLLSC